MPTLHLNPDLFFEITRFLQMQMSGDERTRRAHIEPLFLGVSPLNIDYSGSDRDFCYRLVQALIRYDEITEGKQALWAVLESLLNQVGISHQKQIRAWESVVNPPKSVMMLETAEYIFLSYARANDVFVNQLRTDLNTLGVRYWIDKEGLKPGTPDWEKALREAIGAARLVLLVASRESRESAYVRDELAIAHMHRIPIIPVWATGRNWIDCIPMGRGYMQYIDARGSAYATALPQIVQAVTAGVDLAPTPLPAPETHPIAEPRNPYKGLQAFIEKDEEDFFGRELLVNQLLKVLERRDPPRFLAVIGASGSGKSSVVMAGLIPQLRQAQLIPSHNWLIVEPFTPGIHPLDNLALRLKKYVAGATSLDIKDRYLTHRSTQGLHLLGREIADEQKTERIVLVVDQFEEVFVQTQSEEERQQFIANLITAAQAPDGHFLILLTLRADFYHRTHDYADLAALVDAHKQSTLPMTLAELADAIERPTHLPDVQLQFEAGLVTEIVYALRGQVGALAGALPLLQFTLTRLFEERHDNLLTRSAYEAMGGVQGAIGTHAEAVFAKLDAEAQSALPRVFLSLVNMEGNTPARRRTLQADFEQDPAQQRLVTILTKERLLLASSDDLGQPTVEVAHEALFRSWQRLADWIDDVAEKLRLRARVTQAAYEWHDDQRPDYRLWTHELLKPVYEMQAELNITFADDPVVQAFIKPEWERLLVEFTAGTTPIYRQSSIIDEWKRMGADAAPAMLQGLQHIQNDRSRTEQRQQLVAAIRSHTGVTLKQLQSGTVEERRRAALFMGNLRGEAMVNALILALHDPDEQVAYNAAQSLRKLEHNTTKTYFQAALTATNPQIQEQASQELHGLLQLPKSRQPFDILAFIGELEKNADIAKVLIEQIKFKTSIKSLIAALEDQDNTVSSQAAQALSTIGRIAIEPLLESAKNANSQGRSKIAEILGKIGDARAVDPLINMLNDPDVAVETAARAALVEIEDARAISHLVSLLGDKDVNIRRGTVLALSTKPHEKAIKPLMVALGDPDSSVSSQASQVLSVIGRSAIDLLIENTGNPDQRIKSKIAEVFGNVKNAKAVALLINMLNDQDISVRIEAIVALGKIGDPRAIPYLASSLEDNDVNIRRKAVLALATNPHNAAIKPLIAALDDEDDSVSSQAYQTLSKLGKPIIEALIERAKNANSQGRSKIVEILGKIGDARAVDPLINTLKDPDMTVQTAVIAALSKIMLKEPDMTVRIEVIAALGKIGDVRAVDPLINMLKDNNVTVRMAVIETLGKMGDARAIDPLINMLKDRDMSVRTVVITALGKIGDAKAVDPLLNLLNDSEVSVRTVAITALGKIGDAKAVDPLINMLNNPAASVRIATIKALGKIGNARAVAHLTLLLEDNAKEIQVAGAEALCQIGSPAIDSVIGMLDSVNWYTRYRAAEILKVIGDKRAIEPLQEAWLREPATAKHEGVGAMVTEALNEIRRRKS